jgi:tRNA A-37 threonylcarbamoyl transferase component Bud32
LQSANEINKSTNYIANTTEYRKTQNVNFDEGIKSALRNELNKYTKLKSQSKSPLKASKELKSISSIKKFNLNYSKTSNNDSQSRVLIKYSSNIPYLVASRLSRTRPEINSYRGESHKNSSINSTKKHESSIINDAISINRDTLIESIRGHIKMLNEIPHTSIEYYSQVNTVGKGDYGTVILAIHKLTGKKVAIKCIDKAYMKEQQCRVRVLQEISILKRVRHSNVISLYEVFETTKQTMIVMEYAKHGNLYQYIEKNGKIEENKAKVYIKQILYALAHIHSRNILNGDVRPSNILIDGKGNVKLSNFGNSKIIKCGAEVKEIHVGTSDYIAPEIALNKVISLIRSILDIKVICGAWVCYCIIASQPICHSI